MPGVPPCDVGCMVKPWPLSCILYLLVDNIWRYFYRWLLDLGLGVICGTLLDDVVILCCIDILYMVMMHVEEDSYLHGFWIYVGGGALGTRREGAYPREGF
jgi:hypothetical protein